MSRSSFRPARGRRKAGCRSGPGGRRPRQGFGRPSARAAHASAVRPWRTWRGRTCGASGIGGPLPARRRSRRPMRRAAQHRARSPRAGGCPRPEGSEARKRCPALDSPTGRGSSRGSPRARPENIGCPSGCRGGPARRLQGTLLRTPPRARAALTRASRGNKARDAGMARDRLRSHPSLPGDREAARPGDAAAPWYGSPRARRSPPPHAHPSKVAATRRLRGLRAQARAARRRHRSPEPLAGTSRAGTGSSLCSTRVHSAVRPVAPILTKAERPPPLAGAASDTIQRAPVPPAPLSDVAGRKRDGRQPRARSMRSRSPIGGALAGSRPNPGPSDLSGAPR